MIQDETVRIERSGDGQKISKIKIKFELSILLSRIELRFDILKMQRKILQQNCRNIYEIKEVKAFLHDIFCPLSNV